MADPRTYRPKTGDIPTDAGVYRFRDRDGRVIYVGKAKSLRSRLTSYFQDLRLLHPRTRTMVTTAASVEWTVVRNEVEALQLEYAWIKEYDPRFNVKYRDDKSYPYLAVTMSDEVPRAQVMRGRKKPGTRYFGPFTHAWAIRDTLDQLMRVFPMRTCSAGVYRRAEVSGRPCLLGYIDKCSAPCVGNVTHEEHRAIAEDFCAFMAGDSARFTRDIERRMKAASAELDFEQAARLRDDLGALEKVLQKSAIVFDDATDADVFGLVEDELEAAVQVFHVRGGRIRGQRGWVTDKASEAGVGTPELIERILLEVYGEREGKDDVPREVLVPVLPGEPDDVRDWLRQRRGGVVDLRVPQRGDKRKLAATVTKNAEQALARHKVSRAGDLTARSQALEELQENLGLPEAPLRIECFDISHVQGTNVVGSMVVFEDGLPRKSEYRRFIVAGTEDADGTLRNDDVAAMHEVLTRRFARLARETANGDETTPVSGEVDADDRAGSLRDEDGRLKKFAYRPQLLVVDGGRPQVDAAARALAEVGFADIPVVGLAKRLEEVWLADDDFPVILPRTSEALYLLQRVRDEAHRFAITFHRERRSKAMTVSALDGIAGLGPAKQKALLQHFGTVKAIRAADAEALQEVKGVGPALAESVVRALSSNEGSPAVNVMTGEVLE
ncbi:excinuclease ABC subunit UvrC [Dermacoccus sp. 147Ba]|uniref:excinuclease ABC subunit UvrC n=1 Tax=unclassified Dermacoccus TaxID=2643059 RepID=UPI00101C3559|nr:MULTISPECIES: excinuclease ABC subunit UvrC [unclassified Dermacoccus]QNK52042.1 excinuclease ABC subunit UvrC [Dermacoccus sp. PAMC28757]RYI23684.1 excinuclease ABC subunit UvrC [Dermacoccus sp. 147Ba]